MATSLIRPRPLWVASILFVVTFSVFLPCLWNDFSNFDDPVYVIHNGHTHRGFTWDSIRWAFGSFYAANWHPITWLSHIADWLMFGRQAWGHHLTNIIFNSANVALLFLFLINATGSTWRSVTVAFLFGVHPLHVESVAWIAERKDVLNTFFSLLTLLAYLRWTQSDKPRSPIWYLAALFCFALSLGSKAMSVSLPILLLLLDYWPLQRFTSGREIRRLFLEKIPFLLLTLASVVVTVAAQRSGGAIKLDVPLWVRVANAAVSVARYLGKLFWPHDLIVFYPYTIPSPICIVLSLVLLVCVSAGTIFLRRSLPWLLVGWSWLLISLLPVIGLVQIGAQSMADRYMYWPSIGPLLAITWTAAYFFDKIKLSARLVASLTCLVAAAVSAVTVRQISFWRNSETLFTQALAVSSENSLAHLNLGVALADRGGVSEGLFHLREATRLSPRDPDTHLNLGMALHQKGDLSAAISEFETALLIKPDYAKVHANLAIVFQEQNDFDRAIGEYRQALGLDSDFPDVHVGLGLALQQTGQTDAALAEFEHAIKQDPAFAAAHSNRGIVLEKLGRFEEAIEAYRKALSLDSKNSDSALNLPVTLFKAGQVDEAISEVRELIRQRPDYPEAYFNLGGMLYSKNDFDGAVEAYQHALRLKPDYSDARHNLNIALEGKGDKR